MDFAGREYNHSYRLDPIVRSLFDTDFYKLLMCQFIWENYPNVQTTWAVTNRTKTVKLAEEIDVERLRSHLDHVRTLSATPSELIWLRGQTFYGQEGIFKTGFINALRTIKLPEYHIATTDDCQLELTFSGPWWIVTLWEIYALAIINELRSRAFIRSLPKSKIDIIYARAKVKLYEKLERLNELDDLNLTDFGTRRRHSFLWQEHCVLTAQEVLGDKFTGTSNVHLAMKHGFEPKGTNAHELPMVLAALADDDEALRKSQYEVLRQWQNTYSGNLQVFLPDTFGTSQFLEGAPQWVSNWKGARPDSKEPHEAGRELIDWWSKSGLTKDQVKKKLVIFSDGLEVDLIIDLQKAFEEEIMVGFGWGTNFTNDFRDTVPNDPDALKPISIVCKVKTVNNRPAVKLSDNIQKATGGSEEEIQRYISVFGADGRGDSQVEV